MDTGQEYSWRKGQETSRKNEGDRLPEGTLGLLLPAGLSQNLRAQQPDARSIPTQNGRDLSAGLGGRLKNKANLVSQLVKLEPRSLGCVMGADKFEL